MLKITFTLVKNHVSIKVDTTTLSLWRNFRSLSQKELEPGNSNPQSRTPPTKPRSMDQKP